MNFALLFCVCTITSAKEIIKTLKIIPKCEGIEIRGVFHRNYVLANGLNRPYQLSYHKKNHDIYFSNNVGNDTEDKFEIKRLEKNGTQTTIEEVNNGFATAIDEENQVAYFGGSSGIYRKKLEDGKIDKIIDKHDVWDMFFKKHLYFISFPHQQLYKYLDNHGSKRHKNKHPEAVHEERIHEEIYQFVIDGDDDIFITNKTGLFMIKNGTEHRIEVHGEKTFRAIEINHKGNAYFCGKNDIYAVNKKAYKLEEIAHVKNVFGLTFDNEGHIIYSNPLEIVKLIPSQCKIIGETVSYVSIPIPNY